MLCRFQIFTSGWQKFLNHFHLYWLDGGIVKCAEYNYTCIIRAVCVTAIYTGWSDMSAQVGTNEHPVIFGLIKMNCGHPVVAMSVAIQKDFTWKLHAHGHSFDHSSLLGCFPIAWPSSLCSCSSIYEVLHVLRHFLSVQEFLMRSLSPWFIKGKESSWIWYVLIF